MIVFFFLFEASSARRVPVEETHSRGCRCQSCDCYCDKANSFVGMSRDWSCYCYVQGNGYKDFVIRHLVS